MFLQQDVMFNLLLKTYIHYGTETPAKYWQDPQWYKLSSYSAKSELHYDCRWLVKHEVDLGYSISYVIRNESPEIFETRWSILRFNQWFVISISWFQPDKEKNKRKRRSQIFRDLILDFKHLPAQTKQKNLLMRINHVLVHQFNSKLQPKPTYVF